MTKLTTTNYLAKYKELTGPEVFDYPKEKEDIKSFTKEVLDDRRDSLFSLFDILKSQFPFLDKEASATEVLAEIENISYEFKLEVSKVMLNREKLIISELFSEVRLMKALNTEQERHIAHTAPKPKTVGEYCKEMNISKAE